MLDIRVVLFHLFPNNTTELSTFAIYNYISILVYLYSCIKYRPYLTECYSNVQLFLNILHGFYKYSLILIFTMAITLLINHLLFYLVTGIAMYQYFIITLYYYSIA